MRWSFDSMVKRLSGQRSRGTSPRISEVMAPTRAGVRRATARSLTSIAGPWSQRPVQLVVPMETRPSRLTSSGPTRNDASMRSRSARLPAIASVTLSLKRTRKRPRGSDAKSA